jgi:hypothetical protein
MKILINIFTILCIYKYDKYSLQNLFLCLIKINFKSYNTINLIFLEQKLNLMTI